MYSVLKQLENGEFVHVAARDDLPQALELAESLKIHWPGEYEIRDSHSAVVKIAETPASETRPRTPASESRPRASA